MPRQISLCTMHGMQNTSFLSFMVYKLQILTKFNGCKHPPQRAMSHGGIFGRSAVASNSLRAVGKPLSATCMCFLGMCAKRWTPSQYVSVQNPCQSIPPPSAFEAECLALSSTAETRFALRSQSFQCFKKTWSWIGTPTRTIYRPKTIPKDKLNVSLPHPK